MPIPQDKLKEITEKLDKKIKEKRPTGLVCPACNNNKFNLIDGYTRRELNDNVIDISLGGRGIPSVTAICTNCGYLMDFALGVIGLLPKQEASQQELPKQEDKQNVEQKQ